MQPIRFPRSPHSVGLVFVYFVRCSVTRLVKVGYTTQGLRRLQSLRLGSPTQLLFVAAVKASTEAEVIVIERGLHADYKDHRCHGEWFRLRDEQIRGVPSRYATELWDLPLEHIIDEARGFELAHRAMVGDLLPPTWSDVVSDDVLDDVLHGLELVGEAPTGHPTCNAHAAAEAVANHYFRGSNREGPGWHEAFDRTTRYVAQTYADPWELFT